MGLLPANATALERGLEAVITDLLEGVAIPLSALRVPATCPEPWLPFLAWGRGIDVWSDDWPIGVKRQAIEAAWDLHALKGTVAADRRILDGAGALYDYVEGTGAEHHTVAVKVQNSGTLLVTLDDLKRAIDNVRRASVHYTVTAEAGFCGPLQLAGGFGVARAAFFSGRLP